MSAEEEIRWSVNSTNYITLGYDDLTEDGEALQNVLDESYPEDATVTVTVKDRTGASVTGATNLTMDHVENTSGADTQYRATIPHTANLEVGTYKAVATATKAGVTKEFYKRILVSRGGS